MRIAVAGAGIAGLTSAIALAQRGFSVELFERTPKLEEIGAGIQLSPNAMAVLERLGVAADLKASLVEPQAIDIRCSLAGLGLARIPLGATARRRYGAPYCLIRRADLQAGLLAAAVQRDGITLHLHTEVHDIGASERGIVYLAGGERRLADLLVGADGIHSGIRTGYFGHPGPAPLGKIAWRATLPAASVPRCVSLDVTGLWLGPGAHLVHYPVEGGKSLNVVVIAGEQRAGPAPPAECFGADIGKLIEAVPTWTIWPLFGVDPRKPWVRGHVVLVGDAAHAMAPSAAQGGAQAIEDAWVLARSLATVPERPTDALRAYEQTRRRRVERVVRAARRNLIIYNLQGLAAAVRNKALAALPANLLLARLDWLFGWRPG